MQRGGDRGGTGRSTRAALLRSAVAGAALVGGGLAVGSRGGLGASAAAPSERQDAKILDLFLLLERAQDDFYQAALRGGRLKGELREFAETVGGQESEHVFFLARRLGGDAGKRPRTDFRRAVSSEDAFRSTAIDLEEATIGAYIGQGGNLTREAVGDVARIVSVEARQAAWIRDLAGQNPAPRAADPARTPGDVLAALRKRGVVR